MYNQIERKIARSLESFPILRQGLKMIYQRANYYLSPERTKTQYFLDLRVKLINPCERDSNTPCFFGYYDKKPWSSDMRYLLFHKLANDNKTIEIMLYDYLSNEVTAIGSSLAWNFQQGSMAQWIASIGSNEVVYNTCHHGGLSAHIVNINDNSRRVIPSTIQSLHPARCEALTLNYKRLDMLRPEYGYSCECNRYNGNQDLAKDGIWRVDLNTGETELLISLYHLSTLENSKYHMKNAQHKVNHIIYSPTGKRFVFMHRWFETTGKYSRLYVMDNDGSNLKLIMDERMVSHYHWYDDDHIVVYGRIAREGDRFYLINVLDGAHRIIAKDILDKNGDGHPSFSPDRKWLVMDTYPDRARFQHLYLVHMPTQTVYEVGKFFHPWKYIDAMRCDLHPRWSPDGRFISIDSVFSGIRQSYIIDVSKLLDDVTSNGGEPGE